MSQVTAIVPVKALDVAKSRLTSLSAQARRDLMRHMAQTVLASLALSERVTRVVVITSDPEIAALSGEITIVPDPGQGLNAAWSAGIAATRGRKLLLPADFLRICAADIDRLIDQCPSDQIGLLACKSGSGTNAVILPDGMPFYPEFGEGSFALHRQQMGSRAHILTSATLAFDVDTDADLPSSHLITYSPKVFLPLTHLCRDVCHYCTFAKTPGRITAPFMTVDEVVAIAEAGAKIGCREALFTLGDRPEARYAAARDWLTENGFDSTLHYVAHAAREVRDCTGLLPHINAGCMNADELAMLKPVSASMGLMLESTSERLCQKGGPHFGSPDKLPAARLATMVEAGRQSIPFTTGILIGIGETRDERIEALAAIRELHLKYGHIQEIIIQNFLPKIGTLMAGHPPAPLEELLWTIRAARAMFGPAMSIQCPPNLNEGHLAEIIEAGINDWGGVSPLTPDHVNPEAPWPEIEDLAAASEACGKTLAPRLTIYPPYLADAERWIAPEMSRHILPHADGAGLAREDQWISGRSQSIPPIRTFKPYDTRIARIVRDILDYGAEQLEIDAIASLFNARGADFQAICEGADAVRKAANGDAATYVINRNINYTNICTYRCSFCAFSKGTRKHEGAEKPYLLDLDEVARRVSEARARGASEVCLQGGIHPSFTGETYLSIVRAVKAAVPDMHVHAFSPLEIRHGAKTLGLPLDAYLSILKDAGLGSLPGTAAEILHDPVRDIICPDKLNTAEWLEVIETAHRTGIATTSTIMFGHVDTYRDWAIHLTELRNLQMRTGGITEFVPLPFVAHEAPMFKRGQARRGPTLREAILMHAIARLVLHPYIANVQASWVKLGKDGMRLALQSGANDMGGTLMDESITRAAGATHGQEMTIADMAEMASSLGRRLTRRTTLYGEAPQIDFDLASS